VKFGRPGTPVPYFASRASKKRIFAAWSRASTLGSTKSPSTRWAWSAWPASRVHSRLRPSSGRRWIEPSRLPQFR